MILFRFLAGSFHCPHYPSLHPYGSDLLKRVPRFVSLQGRPDRWWFVTYSPGRVSGVHGSWLTAFKSPSVGSFYPPENATDK